MNRKSCWLGLLAAVPVLRFLVLDAFPGLDPLLHRYLTDDAFYSFEVSRHIPEFNAGIATSGFHPLYVFAIAPLHRGLAPELAVPATLALLLLVLGLGVILLYRLLEPLWGHGVALWCAAAWATSGGLYAVVMTGCETALPAVSVLAFLVLFVRVDPAPGGAPLRMLFALGAVAGLAFWSRLDSVVILAPALAWLGLRLLARPAALLALALPAVSLPLVWLAYCGIVTGSFWPDSAAALRTLRGIDSLAFAPWPLARQALAQLGSGLDAFLVGDAASHTPWIAAGPLLIAAGLCLFLRPAGPRTPQAACARRLFGLFLAGFCLWSAYYVWRLGGFRPWYFAHAGPLLFAVLVPPIVSAAGSALGSARWRTGAGALALALLAALSTPREPRAPQEHDKYRGALVAEELLDRLDPSAAVAAFNTGVYDYAMHRDVLNLDGVVNPEALSALRDRQLPAYLERKGIGYLIEHDPRRAASAQLLFRDPRLRIERWIDLSERYAPFADAHAKRVYLWKLHYGTGGAG